MSDLTAKARRAAEWWKLQDHLYPVSEHGGAWVCVTESGRLEWSDEQFISEAVTQGWQDQEQEADGVEWETKTIDEAVVPVNDPEIRDVDLRIIGPDQEGLWRWDVREGDIISHDSGTAPTRAEARAAAVESARGMG